MSGAGAFALAIALALAGDAFASTKACDNARKKVAREERALAETGEAVARARRARETCVSKSACARFDDAASDGERRGARHAVRLARFREEAAAACR